MSDLTYIGSITKFTIYKIYAFENKKLLEISFLEVRKKMFKILGAKNCRKNLHKYSGPPFQIRGGPGSFSIAKFRVAPVRPTRCV